MYYWLVFDYNGWNVFQTLYKDETSKYTDEWTPQFSTTCLSVALEMLHIFKLRFPQGH